MIQTIQTASFTLTTQQIQALELMSEFLRSTKNLFLLLGYAGTGKSTIIFQLIKILIGEGKRIALTAPTNKAVRVLQRMASKNNIYGVDFFTIHQLLGLGLVRRGGDKVLEQTAPSMLSLFDLVFLDECSMVNKELWYWITESISRSLITNKQLILMGDPAQLPPVNEVKSLSFSVPNKAILTQVVRQGTDKTPKLILSNLLTIYRDLLIIMASPKSQDLITGAIAYSQLKQLATPWDYEAVSTGLTQLQKSENQLRNAAQPHLWLEVCLLGLVTTRSEHSHNSNNTNGSMTASNPLGKSQPKAQRSNLRAIWNKVLEKATPNNRSLLTHAELVELKNGFAVITVEAKYFDKFNSNTLKVERMFQKATGARVTISIKERS
ncbi:MAG: AAA family ATPase [Rhizonema sp. PD38]|nr:AAA family ATPase [Rhizonema sp. PD38]